MEDVETNRGRIDTCAGRRADYWTNRRDRSPDFCVGLYKSLEERIAVSRKYSPEILELTAHRRLD